MTVANRLVFGWFYCLFASLLNAVTIVQPDTIIRWYRMSFRLYWRWKQRRPLQLRSTREGMSPLNDGLQRA